MILLMFKKFLSVLSFAFLGCHIHKKLRDSNTHVMVAHAKCSVFSLKVLTSMVSHAMEPTSITQALQSSE